MKVTLSKYHSLGGQAYEVSSSAVCELKGATIEIRQSKNGDAVIIVIHGGHVSLVPKSDGGILLVVKPKNEKT